MASSENHTASLARKEVPTCKPQKHFAMIKIEKTGSSTLHTILGRYVRENNLNMISQLRGVHINFRAPRSIGKILQLSKWRPRYKCYPFSQYFWKGNNFAIQCISLLIPLFDRRAVVVAVQQPSTECAVIFTVCIV